ncbi:hypothetical protein AYY16_16940 [Morganella psychrotolerans]|nr:hypothetical protein AYY16_16940 [Morganella psychrotolerans]
MDVWCAGTLNNVKNGIWNTGIYGEVSDFDFIIYLSDLKKRLDRDKNFKKSCNDLLSLLNGLGFTNAKHEVDTLRYGDFYQLTTLKIKIKRAFPDNGSEQLSKAISLITEMHTAAIIETEETRCFDEEINNLKAGSFHRRTSVLFSVHSDYDADPRFSNENIIETFKAAAVAKDIAVGVDSGQAGMFDLSVFETVASPESGCSPEHKIFYSLCCDWDLGELDLTTNTITLPGSNQAMGVNSSSGFGDGGYNAHIIADENGEIIAVAFNYMGALGDGEDDE